MERKWPKTVNKGTANQTKSNRMIYLKIQIGLSTIHSIRNFSRLNRQRTLLNRVKTKTGRARSLMNRLLKKIHRKKSFLNQLSQATQCVWLFSSRWICVFLLWYQILWFTIFNKMGRKSNSFKKQLSKSIHRMSTFPLVWTLRFTRWVGNYWCVWPYKVQDWTRLISMTI